MINMIKEYKILLIIFVVALLFRVLFVFVSPIKIWDETVYANLGHDLSKNPFDYSFENNGWSDFVPGDWPNAGFRAPLLPYMLSIFYFLNLGLIIEFLMPLIGALSVVLIFFLAKKMFNENIAIYSAIFLSFLPLHVYFSGKILTDVFSTFFVILTVLFFWQGFEKGKNKYKLLFGIFLALTILARYTTAVLILVFLLYLIIKNKNLLFLKDKFLWLTIILFFITLLPWFIYSLINYGNPLGAFIHAIKAASYWGGVQPWYFFFLYSLQMFSILSFVFLGSLILIIFNKNVRKNSATIFLLLWFFIFFLFTSVTPHKEDRFLLPLVPSFVIISALFFKNLKKYKNLILVSISLILIFSLVYQFLNNYQISYTQENECFLEAMKFSQNLPNDSVLLTDESSITYYYSKKETHFYPSPISINSFRDLIDKNYKNRLTYILFTEFDMPLKNSKNQQTKNILDSNFGIVYKCTKNENSSIIYKYK